MRARGENGSSKHRPQPQPQSQSQSQSPLGEPARAGPDSSRERRARRDRRDHKDGKDRRLAKLRHRTETMDPPILSFYGRQPVPLPLPSRFAGIKRRLVAGHEAALHAS